MAGAAGVPIQTTINGGEKGKTHPIPCGSSTLRFRASPRETSSEDQQHEAWLSVMPLPGLKSPCYRKFMIFEV
ncbi:hypothetical protein SAY86_014313 [Trapa natans]|uniref:Uncharacterized protein n=1 Tax=Trapa natans TaxID=22666 RepID=A0AAN7KY36_TRANT|nr:hypothetical protein SAY86_014313 [Trapa natans]